MPIIEREGESMVLLVTTRGRSRWVLPKGWAEAGVANAEVAAKEAYEEAGLAGRVDPLPAGRFAYAKRGPGGRVAYAVEVFVMQVEREYADWPEQRQRQRRWFRFAEAAERVTEPELAALLLDLGAAIAEAA